MSRPSPAPPSRIAGSLVLALPLAAAAGCGAREEDAPSRRSSPPRRATSPTARRPRSRCGRRHPAATSRALAVKDGSLETSLADALVGASITYVVDPTGDQTLGQSSASGTSLSTESLKETNLAFVVRDDKATLGEIRVVDGVLYLHVDVEEIGRSGRGGRRGGLRRPLDAAGTDGPPELAGIIKDLRAGKWISSTPRSTSTSSGARPGLLPGADRIARPPRHQGLGERPVRRGQALRQGHRRQRQQQGPRPRRHGAGPSRRSRRHWRSCRRTRTCPSRLLLGRVRPSDIDENLTDGTAGARSPCRTAT